MRQDVCNTSSRMLALIGGIGIGAALGLLMEPQTGSRRRKQLTKMASGAGESLSNAWEAVRDRGAEVGDVLRSGAKGLGASVGVGASTLKDWIESHKGSAVHRTYRGAQYYGKRLGEAKAETSDRLSYLVRGKQYHPMVESGTGQLLTALGCIALGAGVMYMLDPVAGRRRRAIVRDKMMSATRQTGGAMGRSCQNLWNRTSGQMHELKAKVSRENVSDDVLAERVRAQIGHAISDVSRVRVQARNGRVVLSGNVSANEVDPLLKRAWATRGVKEIVNQLNFQPLDAPASMTPCCTEPMSGSVGVPASAGATQPMSGSTLSGSGECPSSLGTPEANRI